MVGGGISGLATAYLCAKRGMSVTVFEKGEPGGKIHSAHEEGFLLEHGPQGFLDSVPESLTLASELGLEPLRANETAKKRFLYFRGALQRVPESPPLLIKSKILSLRGKARLAWEPFAKKRTEPDETVMAFATRRLGHEAAERLVAPMVAGIYAGDADKLSIDSALPRVAKLERDHGSLIRAMRKLKASGPGPRGTLTSFKGGMGDVINALLAKLGPAVVRAHVRSIEFLGSRDGASFRVRTDDSGPAPADAVVLATPGYATASLVPDVAPLAEIPYAPVDVAFLGYPRDAVPHPLDGFGFLVAPGEDLRVLGCLWESSIFPFRAPDGSVLFRLMLGGARDPGVAGLSPAHVLTLAREALEKSIGIRAEPRLSRLVRHPRGIPQYTVGHAQRVAAATAKESAWPGLYLTGNALRGVGYNDCVREAYAVADRVARHAS